MNVNITVDFTFSKSISLWLKRSEFFELLQTTREWEYFEWCVWVFFFFFFRNLSAPFIMTHRNSCLSTRWILAVYENITTVSALLKFLSAGFVRWDMGAHFSMWWILVVYEIKTAVSSTFVETSYWYVITLMLSFIVRELLKSFFHGQRS